MKIFLKHYWYSVVLCLGFWWVMSLGASSAVQAQDDPGNGSISGVVTNAQGDGVPDVYVTSYIRAGEPGNFYPQPVSSMMTDERGAYTITNLFSGTYQLAFEETRLPPRYVNEIYNNVTSWSAATDIPVGISETITGIDATLGKLGQISGTVTNDAGTPIPGLFVVPFKIPDDGQQYNAATTDSNGVYTITGLMPGVYGVYFEVLPHLPYQSEYYDNVSTLAGAKGITVAVDATVPNIDAQLTLFGRIQGVVTDEEGNPLQDIGVAVYSDPKRNGNWQQEPYLTTTDERGVYTYLGLKTGLYRLYFRDNMGRGLYSAEYYDNATTLQTATSVSVTNGATTTVDIQLGPPGGITGQVTDPNDNPLSTVQVSLLTDQDGNGIWESGVYFTAPDASGIYTFTALDAGAYRLYFQDYTQRYAPEFYRDSVTLAGATDVTVTGATLTPNIDAQLNYYSHITGTVTDESGNPLTNILVTAYTWRTDINGNFDWFEVNNQYTNNEGHYKVGGLITGVYRLRFADGFNNFLHTEYYDDAGYVYTADDIAVGVAMTVTNIDAQLSPFTAVNYPPLARDDATKVGEGGTTNSVQFGDISLLANDRDAEFMPITPTLVTSPTHGIVTLLATGLFTYTHNGDGATIDYFTYKVNDGVYDSNVATVTVAITQTNDAPLALNNSYTLTTGATLTGSNVLDNDSDEEGDVLTATLVTSPTHGALTLAANGFFTYTHNGSETLTDTFAYVANDGITTSNVATVHLIISPTTPLVSFILSKTVGIDGIEPLCTAKGEMKVPVGTAVVYCYTVRNSGGVTLTTHSLVDSDLGQLLNNITYTLAPGAIYSVTFTKTLTVSITNVATWTATIADVGQSLRRNIPGATGNAATAATVLISGPTDDQDGDTIPDNLEGWNDPDGDNIPNFLDTNADGDSKSDQEEVGDPTKPADSDQDGIPDFLDSDGSLPGLNLKQFLPLIHK